MNNIAAQEVMDAITEIKVENPVIDISHLQKSFGNQEILKDISLQLGPGENLAVLGKSGSGKSVLIKCMVGLLKPDSGSITILDQDVTSLQRKELNQLRQKIGFLFQGGALYDSMTVKQNIEFPLRRISVRECGFS
jgi:phospholipid/cholesterol/gamma-HCH transport system ATP-binding protein